MIKTALLGLALILASEAVAQPRGEEPPLQSEQVNYADLNLGSARGQALLRHRIQIAAGRVCDTGGMRSMEDFMVTAQCYRLSYEDAVRQMDRAIAARRTGAVLAASTIVIRAR